MTDITPTNPQRPLLWSDTILDLQDRIADFNAPIYVVGGAVRDAYLHRPIKDLDLVTPTRSIDLARTIADAYAGDVFIMDQERGVARTFIDTPQGETLTIDVAKYRGASLLADLTDRDFTINAMAVDFKGDMGLLLDPLDGEADIKVRRIRRCTDHALQDDFIRALRAVRQSVQLDFRIDRETLQDVKAQGQHLLQTSPERIRDEFFAILGLRRPMAALRVLEVVGLLGVMMPEVVALKGIPHPIGNLWEQTLQTISRLRRILDSIGPLRTDETAAAFDLGMLVMQLDRYRNPLYTHLADTRWANGRGHEALLMLAALLHQVGGQPTDTTQTRKLHIAHYAEFLRLSNDEKQRLQFIMTHYQQPQQLTNMTALDIHRFWFGVDAAGVDACLLSLADYLAGQGADFDQDAWLLMIDRMRQLLEAYFERYDEVVQPPVLLDGNALQEHFNLEPGRIIGHLLTAICEAQVTGDVKTRDDALTFARRFLADHRAN